VVSFARVELFGEIALAHSSTGGGPFPNVLSENHR